MSEEEVMAQPRSPLGSLGVLLLLVAGAVASSSPVSAQPVVKLPFFVVKDTNGDVVGPIIDYEGGQVVVGLVDPVFGNTIPLEIRTLAANTLFLESSEPTVFYEFTNCQGTAYLTPPASSLVTTTILLGRAYGVGEGSGSSLWLYRGSGAGSSIEYDSHWSNGSCSNSTATLTLVVAQEIIDIEAEHPGPYTLE
jgi:hypothetical protein